MARVRISLLGAGILAFFSPAAAHAIDCFVDSVAGDDTKSGLTEADAVQSPAKVPSTCTAVKFKRGSEFKLANGVANLGLKSMNSIKLLANYGDSSQPLPKFTKDHVDGSGGMLQTYMGGVSVDGLYLAGSKSSSSMSNLGDGIGVMVGGGTAAQPSEVKNCEITLCDIGMMTTSDYVNVHDNYIHDLSISVDAAPGVDPNAVGGAEGIFVNSSHVRVHHNRFVNCSTAAQWVSNTNGGGIRCDGGATEVSIPNGKNGAAGEITDVEIDHNFSYNSCGFFEVASMFQSGTTYVKGHFTNSVFHDNVMVDSGWISLLQVNNTKLLNVRWENNTIVHHDMGTKTVPDPDGGTIDINLNDFGSSSIQAIAFNSTSSGVTGGGEISPGDIYWTNNLWYYEPKVKPYNLIDPTHRGSDALLANITVTGDVVVTTDPGFKDATSRSDPTAYDLVASSIAIDKGVTDDSVTQYVTTDFAGRARPAGTAFDLGAFEYGAASAGGAGGSGGASGAGGATTAPATGKGGAGGTATTPSTGGTSGTTTVPVGSGGATATGGRPGSGGAIGAGGRTPTTTATGGSTVASTAGSGGAPGDSGGVSGNGGTTSDTTVTQAGGKSGCSCHLGQNGSSSPIWLGLLGFAWLARRRRSQRD